MHQKAPFAERVHIEDIALFIGAHMGVFQKNLAAFNIAIAVVDIHAALADGLDLGAFELDTGFVGVDDLVFMAGFSVHNDVFDGIGHMLSPLSAGMNILYHIIPEMQAR